MMLEILKKNKQAIFVFLSVFFLIELLRTAWIGDDIQITLRVVWNFLQGYGPRFNIDERVQVYTHPLWFLIFSAVTYLTRNVILTAFLVPIAVSFLVFWLFLTKLSKNFLSVMLAACALMLSQAYIDYSGSGLENPLSHLLIVLSIILAEKLNTNKNCKTFIFFFLLGSFLYLSRADLVLLMAPLFLYIIVQNRSNSKFLCISILIGVLPALLWSLFSLYYYGFLFPNTAYAKLGTAIVFKEKVEQGFIYLFDSFGKDPLTLSLAVFSIFLGFRSSVINRCLAIGVSFYLVYIIIIGGDFMSGRFLTEIFLVSAIILARFEFKQAHYFFVAMGIFLLGAMNSFSTLSGHKKDVHCVIQKNGIADERGCHFENFGLINLSRKALLVPNPRYSKNNAVHIMCGGLGRAGLNHLYNTYYIDSCALTDPLLSHLPAEKDPYWRIGHFERAIPEGYVESIEMNKNVLVDPELHTYYDVIREITRADLNSKDRLKKIILINLGAIKPPSN